MGKVVETPALELERLSATVNNLMQAWSICEGDPFTRNKIRDEMWSVLEIIQRITGTALK